MMTKNLLLTFANMSKWKQNQEKKSLKDDKQAKRFHGSGHFENCSCELRPLVRWQQQDTFVLEKHLIGDRQQVKFRLDFGKYPYLLAYELSIMLFSVLFLVN